MINFFNKRIFIILIFPFILGGITFLGFRPFNLFFINALSLSLLFYLIFYVKKKTQSSYRKKPFLKNIFFLGSSYGFGFFLFGIYWISYSLTFISIIIFFITHYNYWSFYKNRNFIYNFNKLNFYNIRFYKKFHFYWFSMESLGL